MALVTALVGACWATMILVILGGRLRRGEHDERSEVGDWALLEATPMASVGDGHRGG